MIMDLKDWDPVGKKVLLYSGGLDSWLISKIYKPDVLLYVNMGTKYTKKEMDKLREDVVIEELDLSKWERSDAIIPLRNLYLLMVATNYGDEICLGANAGDRVLDKSMLFAEKATDILSYLYSPQHWIPKGREIKVNFDYKNYTKKQLLQLYVQKGGSLAEAFTKSFSCYGEGETECWSCNPCFRKFVAFASLGMQFPDHINLNMKKYMESKNIISDIITGMYGRETEEPDILHIYDMLCMQYNAR